MEKKQLLKLDGSDSDEMKEFELPPARMRRPKLRKALAEAKVAGSKSSLLSFRCCSFLIISGVLCASILIFGWMLMNMHNDIISLQKRNYKLNCDMGKQSSNFEYFKPQQNGSSLALSDSDSDNSDSKAMFKLPDRKVIRSKGSSYGKRKKGFCCRVCCHSIAPFVISIFVIGTLVAIGSLLLGVSGMKRELELLKIKIEIVQSESHSNLKDSRELREKLQKDFSSSMKGDKDEIKILKTKVATLSKEVKSLNATVIRLKLKSEASKSASLGSIAKDVKLLKKGMADTGGELKSLSDKSVNAKKTIALLTKVVRGIKKELVKIAHSLEQVNQTALPKEAPDTLAPMLSSAAPPEDSHTQSLGKISKLIKKVLNGYSEMVKNKTKLIDSELEKIKLTLIKRNVTYQQTIGAIRDDIEALQDVADKHEEKLGAINAKLQGSRPSLSNSTSNIKVLGIVKEILEGMKKHQSLISNLTARVEKIDKTSNAKHVLMTTSASKVSATTKAKVNAESKEVLPTSSTILTNAITAPSQRTWPSSATDKDVIVSQHVTKNVTDVPLHVNGSSVVSSNSNNTTPVVMVNSTEVPMTDKVQDTTNANQTAAQPTEKAVTSSEIQATTEASKVSAAAMAHASNDESEVEPTASKREALSGSSDDEEMDPSKTKPGKSKPGKESTTHAKTSSGSSEVHRTDKTTTRSRFHKDKKHRRKPLVNGEQDEDSFGRAAAMGKPMPAEPDEFTSENDRSLDNLDDSGKTYFLISKVVQVR
eukprot:gene7719-8558_t